MRIGKSDVKSDVIPQVVLNVIFNEVFMSFNASRVCIKVMRSYRCHTGTSKVKSLS